MDLKSMISGYNNFLRLLIVLLLMTASYCFGRVQQDSDIANLTAEATEGLANEEIKAIYELLSASAFTSRANMNLAAKTNHYITHPQGRDGRPPNTACDECWQEFAYVVENMPKMDPPNEAYFDAFYRHRYRQWKKLREEQNK